MNLSLPSSRNRKKIIARYAAVASFLLPLSASAANIVFSVPNGDWLIPGNWSSGSVPASGDSVFIRGGRLATLAGNAGAVATVYLGDANSSGDLELNSGATLTADTVQVGRINQPNPDGLLFVNQGTLTATTLLTIGGEQSNLNGGTGRLEFLAGSVSAPTVTVGASNSGKSGTLSIHGNSGSFSGTDFNLNAQGKLMFTLGTSGVTPLVFPGTATLSPDAELEVDGSAYTGGAGTLTLIDADTLVGSAGLRVVSLTGFAPTYSATVEVDPAQQNLILVLALANSNAGKFVDRLHLGQSQTLVTYGTSITKLGFWSAQLMAVLDRQFPGQVTHINAGNNGRNSEFGKDNLDSLVLSQDPDCVFIEFTINDSVDNGQVSLAASRANLEGMIDRILIARPDCEVVLQLMNPAVEPTTARHDQEAYQQIYRDVAAARALLLVDNVPGWQAIHFPNGVEDIPLFKRLVPDGVHPNNTGVAMVVVPNITNTLQLDRSYATWRTSYSPNASVDGQLNADSDSLSDAAEYVFDQDPNSAATAGVAGTLADGTPCYRFSTLKMQNENTDFALRVETSPDNATWTSLPFGRAIDGSGTAFGSGVILSSTEPTPTVAYPTGSPYIRFVADLR